MASYLDQCISVKTQNQIDHCDETKKEYSWLTPHSIQTHHLKPVGSSQAENLRRQPATFGFRSEPDNNET